jgi:hypothetical protein
MVQKLSKLSYHFGISGPDERALVGLDDGILDILKVSPLGYKDLVCVKIHQNRIMGISYYNINGIVYTI